MSVRRILVVDAPAAGEFDLAYVDIMLGEQSGLDGLRLVRERLPFRPVVMATGKPSLETAAEALRRGAFDHIVKPFRKESLLRVSCIALEQKSLLEERERSRSNIEAIFRSQRDIGVMVDERLTVLEAHVPCGIEGALTAGTPERKTDIPQLTRHFLGKLGARLGRPAGEVSREVMEVLLAHDWPGNVRELENVLERALILAEAGTITTRDLPPELLEVSEPGSVFFGGNVRERIESALAQTGGNRTEAARLLGWSRRTFYRRLTENGLLGEETARERALSPASGKRQDSPQATTARGVLIRHEPLHCRLLVVERLRFGSREHVEGVQ